MSSYTHLMPIACQRVIDGLACRGLGLAVLVLMVCKAWIDYDTSWDSWWYHVPIAGRLWGITPADRYQMEQALEKYYEGMPHWAEWIQGFFWVITGRLQATNLLCCAGLILYVCFLHRRFSLPLTWVVISLLAIPLVQVHAVSTYIDLPANLAISASLLIVWQWFAGAEVRRWRDSLSLAALCVFAANCKYQALAGTFIVMGAVFFWVFLQWVRGQLCWRSHPLTPYYALLALFTLVGVLYVPFINILEFGNPFHPFIITSAAPDAHNAFVLSADRMQSNLWFGKWLYSIFELDRPYAAWSIDQLNFVVDPGGNRKGGYHVFYVLGNLGLFAYLLRKLGTGRDRRALLGIFIVNSLVSAWMPRPQELRYYMFWMIWLVSANLVLLQREPVAKELIKLWRGYVLVMWLTVTLSTKAFFALPQGVLLHDLFGHVKRQVPMDFVPVRMDMQHVEFGLRNGVVCVVRQQPFTYLYSEYFHKPHAYRVIARYSPHECPKGTVKP